MSHMGEANTAMARGDQTALTRLYDSLAQPLYSLAFRVINDASDHNKNLLSQDFNDILKKSGVFFEKRLIDFATDFNNEQKAILVFAEKNITSETAKEIFNLILITGKLGKTSSGLISLKEKNNSQGLFDMGIMSDSYVSG